MRERYLFPERLKSEAARRFLATGVQPRRQAEKLIHEFERKVRDGEAPNDIRIMLHPRRYARMAPDIPEIRGELLAYLDDRCREEGWTTAGERRVYFSTDATVPIDGERILISFRDDPGGRPTSEPVTVIPEQPVAAPPTDRVAAAPVRKPRPLALPSVGRATKRPREHKRTIPTVVLRLSGGEQVPVPHLPFRIGRAVDNDLVLASFAISRHHAELAETDEGITLRDVGSRNGLVVDGERREVVPAEHGTRVQLGTIEILIERPSRNGKQ